LGRRRWIYLRKCVQRPADRLAMALGLARWRQQNYFYSMQVSAQRLQAYWRHFMFRRDVAQKLASRFLQRLLLGTWRHRVAAEGAAALCLQRVWRGLHPRLHLVQARDACKHLQRRWRVQQARKRALLLQEARRRRNMQEQLAVISIQAAVRSWIAHSFRIRALKSAVHMQAAWRRALAMLEVQRRQRFLDRRRRWLETFVDTVTRPDTCSSADIATPSFSSTAAVVQDHSEIMHWSVHCDVVEHGPNNPEEQSRKSLEQNNNRTPSDDSGCPKECSARNPTVIESLIENSLSSDRNVMSTHAKHVDGIRSSQNTQDLHVDFVSNDRLCENSEETIHGTLSRGERPCIAEDAQPGETSHEASWQGRGSSPEAMAPAKDGQQESALVWQSRVLASLPKVASSPMLPAADGQGESVASGVEQPQPLASLASSKRLLDEVRTFQVAIEDSRSVANHANACSVMEAKLSRSPSSNTTSVWASVANQSTTSANQSDYDEDESENDDLGSPDRNSEAMDAEEEHDIGGQSIPLCSEEPPLPTSLRHEVMVAVRSESGTSLAGRPIGSGALPSYPPLQLLSAPAPGGAWMATPREVCVTASPSAVELISLLQHRDSCPITKAPLHVIIGPPSATKALHKSGKAAAAEAAAAWRGLHRSCSASRAASRTNAAADTHTVAGVWDFINSNDGNGGGGGSGVSDPASVPCRPGKMFPGRPVAPRIPIPPSLGDTTKRCTSARAGSNRDAISHVDVPHSFRGSALRAARELRSSSSDCLRSRSVSSAAEPAPASCVVPQKLRPSRPNSAAAQLTATYMAAVQAGYKGPCRNHSRSRASSGSRATPNSSPKSNSGRAGSSNTCSTPGPCYRDHRRCRGASAGGAAPPGDNCKSDSDHPARGALGSHIRDCHTSQQCESPAARSPRSPCTKTAATWDQAPAVLPPRGSRSMRSGTGVPAHTGRRSRPPSASSARQ